MGPKQEQQRELLAAGSPGINGNLRYPGQLEPELPATHRQEGQEGGGLGRGDDATRQDKRGPLTRALQVLLTGAIRPIST